ncbi:hypothetical protein [Dubosiella muris]|uniref:hypothetical protein n=1 Tax=Dubosiella muris TaxID=3038133 RepID=UPI00241011E2|nr:hypothetical protein [Dubosiella muris]
MNEKKKDPIVHEVDGLRFHLNTKHDFAWLKRYGEVFSVIDATGSGCVCFGMDDGQKKRFVKVAGMDTVEAEISPGQSIETLKHAVKLYEELKHPYLITLLDAYPVEDGYAAVFDWCEGDCLFEHWNFDRYKNGQTDPRERFKQLPALQKLAVVDAMFSFLETVVKKGYVAVDFYDGSLLYDFAKDQIMICDIDLFQKGPLTNEIGADYWGTKRLKAPEEYEKGAVIDERTNVFTLGALLLDFFGTYTKEEVKRRYKDCRVVPCALAQWSLNEQAYAVVCRAVDPAPDKRYSTIAAFHRAWQTAIHNEKKPFSA